MFIIVYPTNLSCFNIQMVSSTYQVQIVMPRISWVYIVCQHGESQEALSSSGIARSMEKGKHSLVWCCQAPFRSIYAILYYFQQYRNVSTFFERSSLASAVNLTSLGRGNLNWGITFIRLTCGCVYGAFSKLLIDVGEPGPLWAVPFLGR